MFPTNSMLPDLRSNPVTLSTLATAADKPPPGAGLANTKLLTLSRWEQQRMRFLKYGVQLQ
jgi:hypothetical protein